MYFYCISPSSLAPNSICFTDVVLRPKTLSHCSKVNSKQPQPGRPQIEAKTLQFSNPTTRFTAKRPAAITQHTRRTKTMLNRIGAPHDPGECRQLWGREPSERESITWPAGCQQSAGSAPSPPSLPPHKLNFARPPPRLWLETCH